ncbi:MAG: BlaI/MecI/CopY family transcriptional regulator [Okeania sp. SIO2D1]|nr:BlaI/MecI/CopY family transcriptional regulator [Okeania sp. SIO2D1]
MLRTLFLNHEIKVSDPHAHNNDWLDSWEVVGGNYDYKAIDQALKGYFDRLKTSESSTTSIWDECTNYAENCQSDYAEKFLKSVLADCRKSNEFPILLSHGETLSNLGGGKGGASKMKDEGLTTLKLLRESDSMGEDKPAFKGYLSGLDYAEDGKPISYSVELNPDWMNPNYLLNIFPELMPQTESKKQQKGNNIISTPLGKFDLNKEPEDTKSLDDLESEILAFCLEKGTATVREIQNKFKSLGIKAETIKFILKGLEDKGLGSVTVRKVGGAESISFTANPTPAVDS